MNKTEFAKELMIRLPNDITSKAQADRIVNGFLGVIEDELKAGGKVQFAGFGTYSVTERKARKGRNVATGEMIDIPAKKVPKFSAGATLKNAVK